MDRVIVTAAERLESYVSSSPLVQLVQTHQLVQTVKRSHEQVDDALQHPSVVPIRLQFSRLWEQPFEISCQQLVQDWVEWFQRDSVIDTETCNDEALQLEMLTLLRYELMTYRVAMSGPVWDLLCSTYDAVARKANVCVLSVPSWFIPSYQLHQNQWEGERVLVKRGQDQEERSTEVVQQADLRSHLHHRNIVRFIGANHVGSDPYMLFGDAEAPSLGKYLRSSPRDRREVWHLLADVAQGVAYLHQQYIALGGLTCEEVIVCNEIATAPESVSPLIPLGQASKVAQTVAKLISDTLHTACVLQVNPRGSRLEVRSTRTSKRSAVASLNVSPVFGSRARLTR